MKPAAVGEIRTYTLSDGGTVQKIKTESGKWKYLKSSGRKFKKYGPDLRRNRKRYESNSPIKKPQPMPPRNTPRKIAAPQPKPIKRTGMTDAEKLAAGYEWIWLNSKTKVLRHPDKLTA